MGNKKEAETCTESVVQEPLGSSTALPKQELNFYTDPSRVFFPDSPEEIPLTTEMFIASYSDFANVFELMAKMFVFVKKDQMRVLAIMEKFYHEDPVKYRLLTDLIEHARDKKRKDVLGSILWMRRTADLITKSMMEVYEGFAQGKQPKVNEVAYKVYKRDMYRFHGMVNKQLFGSALYYFFPSNDEFFKNMNYGKAPLSNWEIITYAHKYCMQVARTVEYLERLYTEKGVKESELREV